jgi:hypothetical protein
MVPLSQPTDLILLDLTGSLVIERTVADIQY